MSNLDKILEGLHKGRLDESAGNFVSVVKYPKGLSEKDTMDIVSHVFGPNNKEMSLNIKELEGLNIKISGISKDGSYDIEILKSQNKPWSKGWTSVLNKYDATKYNNGYMLTGFKTSKDLKDFANKIEDAKKASANSDVEAVKAYLGKDLKKHNIYDYEESDYLVKIVKQQGDNFIIQYSSGDTKEVDANYVLYDTDFGDTFDL